MIIKNINILIDHLNNNIATIYNYYDTLLKSSFDNNINELMDKIDNNKIKTNIIVNEIINLIKKLDTFVLSSYQDKNIRQNIKRLFVNKLQDTNLKYSLKITNYNKRLNSLKINNNDDELTDYVSLDEESDIDKSHNNDLLNTKNSEEELFD